MMIEVMELVGMMELVELVASSGPVVGAPDLVLAGVVVQAAGAVPAELLEALDTLLRLSSLAMLVIPVAEVRKVLGGLPAIGLPGGHEVRAGRWFSWLVAVGVTLFGHWVGWLSPPEVAGLEGWLVMEWSVVAGVANVVYERFWRGQVGLGERSGRALMGDAVLGEWSSPRERSRPGRGEVGELGGR